MAIPLSKPLFSWVILGINIFIWLLMTIQGGSTNTEVLIRFGAKVNALIVEGEVWRLFTACFLHIGIMHLAFNSFALFHLGPEVERIYGRPRFLAIYLLAGLYGSLASFAFNDSISAGASGAIFGLVGALLAFFNRYRDLFGAHGRAYLQSMLFIVGINFIIGLTSPGIDNWGHGGGLVAGFLIGTLLSPRYRAAQPSNPFAFQEYVSLRDTLPPTVQVGVVAGALLLLVAGTSLASSLQVDSVTTLTFQAQALMEEERYVEAEQLLREASHQDPERVDVLFQLGVARARQDNYIGALEAWERAAALEPDLANLRWNLAIAYANLGNQQAAIAEAERFLELARTQDEIRRGRELLAELGAGE